MKDFFDLRHLASTLTLDGATLAEAIQATFDRRSTDLPKETPMGLSAVFAAAPTKQTQWGAFLQRLRLGPGQASLNETIVLLRSFLMPPVEALTHRRAFRMSWQPGGPWCQM